MASVAAPATGDDAPTWRLTLPDERATQELARLLATFVGADDLVTLSGELGAGKTTFARALVRTLLADDEIEVPSPTFTLMQVYDGPTFPIVHADLYRIEKPDELAELGWDEAADGALVLVEWIDRAGDQIPIDRLDVGFHLAPDQGETARIVDLTAFGAFEPRLRQAKAIVDLMEKTGWPQARRAFMMGDASTRAYERLAQDDRTAILMIAPARPDGPIVKDGKSYSTLAHLAEDIRPFIAVATELAEQGYSAPRILGSDAHAGLAILEDLGSEGVTADGAPMLDRYTEAVAVLADLHGRSLPRAVVLPSGERYMIPRYDMPAYLVEVELLLDWYALEAPASNAGSVSRARFLDMWTRSLNALNAAAVTWVLRDYHSPNLIWLPERAGLQRVGLIDFQDCLLGHPAYDLVSLLQDARVTVPDDMEIRLLSSYTRLRRTREPAFDMASFARAYALLGAQRATKILGIFARLDKRDGKPHYLQHIPRVEAYLAKNLRHPALAEIRAWYRSNLPHIMAE